MHIKHVLSLLFASVLTLALRAQDIHFTQYNMSVMALNPAQIGNFEGTVRLGGIYRGQWASVYGGSDQFKTPYLWADAPIIRGFRKRDWVSVGLMFFADKAGELGLRHNAQKLGASYNLALDKKGNSYFSLGVNWGSETRSVNYQEARFGDGLLLGGPEKSLDYASLAGAPKANYQDIDGGVQFRSTLNKKMDFHVGFSMFHLFTPDFTLQQNATDTTAGGGMGGGVQSSKRPLARRSVLHGQFNIATTDRMTISPTFLYQSMSGQDEIVVQGLASYLFDPQRDITLRFGVGYRMRDALQILLGVKQKDLTVGFAYDINTSDLTAASNYRGGFEIAANYIIRIYKPANAKPKVICPRF